MVPARGAAADEYDALADLFLGPTDPAERRGPIHPIDDAPAPLKFPTGERRAAQPTHAREPLSLDTPDDADDRLQAILSDAAPVDPAAPELEPAGQIELIAPAHLPVMASAWVHQYARSASLRAGVPVGLVRFRGSTVSVEALGPAEELATLGPAASAADAVRSAAPVCRAWMVQAPEGFRPVSGVSCVTILTGADDAAVVGCYRKLKELFPPGTPASTRARVVIVGASPDRSAAAMRKISRAACEFLGRTIEFGEPMPRVGSGPGDPSLVLRPLHAGASAGDAEDFLALVAQAAARDQVGPAAPAPATARVARTPVLIHAQPPAPAPVRAPAPATVGAHAAAPPARAPRHEAATIELAPLPSAALVTLVSGLHPLPLRCPVAGGVELACDDEGRLHVVAGADLPAEPRPAAEAVEALLTASAWATLNAGLLRSAAPAIRRLDESAPPAMHLVTGEPVKARRLLDAPLRVHVVVTAKAPGHVAKALN